MTPNVDERMASVIRSLTEVVLPHLPPEASLAQEQVHLSIGHLQIIRAQLDGFVAFERGELDDALAIGRDLADAVSGGTQTSAALTALRGTLDAAVGGTPAEVRGQTRAINDAIDGLVVALSADGSDGARERMKSIVLTREAVRANKDRRLFLPFGFDTMDTDA
jgi:hypothetical protein